MRRDHGPPAEGPASFHTTHWTVVLRAAQSQECDAPAALGQLFRLYWYPLYSFARHYGHSPDDAQDFTQGFFLRLSEHKTLTRADPLKGKFRSFLLTSFKNYLCTEAERSHRQKRGGRTVSDPDEIDAEIRALCTALIASGGSLEP